MHVLFAFLSNGKSLFLDRASFMYKQEHRELAREAVRKSLVLLKNGKSSKKPLLPLPKKSAKILVAGSHADNLGYQCGGWTIAWQGLSDKNLTSGKSVRLMLVSAKIL